MPLRPTRTKVGNTGEGEETGVREQAREEPQWFAFRTDLSLRGGPLSRTRLAWSPLLLAACGACAAVYGALWLVSLDAEPLFHSLGDLSRLLGLLPT
jgi:hypothetical protein